MDMFDVTHVDPDRCDHSPAVRAIQRNMGCRDVGLACLCVDRELPMAPGVAWGGKDVRFRLHSLKEVVLERDVSPLQEASLVYEDVWSELRDRLGRWLRLRVRNLHDREDLVAECLARVWRNFSNSCRPLRELWSWCLTTVRSLLVDSWRRAQTVRSAPISNGQAGPVGVSFEWALESLRTQASTCDRQTLDSMLTGVSLIDLAVARGVTLRAVRYSQGRLLALARKVGKECW